MGCVGSKQKESADEKDPLPTKPATNNVQIEEDKASIGVKEDLPFIDENNVGQNASPDEVPSDEKKEDDELPARESIVLKEETADSENVQVIKEEGDGVEHERIIVTKQVKVIREEVQFTKPGDAEPSSEEKKSTETETIKERHVITKRVLQIDGEDVPGTESTKEEVTREVIVNEEKEETVDKDDDAQAGSENDNVANRVSTVEEKDASPEPEAVPTDHESIEVKLVNDEESEPLANGVNGHAEDTEEQHTVVVTKDVTMIKSTEDENEIGIEAN